MKLRALLPLLGAGFLTACNGFTPPLPPGAGSEYHGRQAVFSGFPTPMLFIATATQWNEHYAVTAAHTPFIDGIAHRCSTGCDLVFIKRKANGPIPTWREPVPGEEVVAVGYSGALLMPVMGVGQAKSTLINREDEGSSTLYATHDAPLTVGMSGGPVYGSEDKAVLGINIGLGLRFTWLSDLDDPLSIGHARRNAFYISTRDVQAEWEIYQASQRAETMLSAAN
jgi:hypothetical protein